jgi:2-dehydropantoate 2-reductase
MQFLVYGAGAVGSVLGGMLSVHKHDVCLIGRDAHMDAIAAAGLRIKSATGEYVAHPAACTSISSDVASSADCVVLDVGAEACTDRASVQDASAVAERQAKRIYR